VGASEAAAAGSRREKGVVIGWWESFCGDLEIVDVLAKSKRSNGKKRSKPEVQVQNWYSATA
jgi:hypothetical protein